MTKSPLSRVLVLDSTAALRADYRDLLCRPDGAAPPAADGDPKDGDTKETLEATAAADDDFAELFGCLAPPPGFPAVDLVLAEDAAAALAAVKAGRAARKAFAVAFVELRATDLESDLRLLEAMRAADPDLLLVAMSADTAPHPLEVAQRVPPVEQIFYLQKPFHPYEIQNLVMALTARWHSERMRGGPAAARAGAGPQGGLDVLPCGLVVFDRRDCLVTANSRLRALLPEIEELLVPGLPYETLQQEIARRLLPEDTLFLEDAWVKERLEWHAKSGGVIDQRLSGGRWLILAESGGPLGETYCLYLDVSGLRRRDQNRAAGQRLRQVAEALEAFSGALAAAADDDGRLPVKDLDRRLFRPVVQGGAALQAGEAPSDDGDGNRVLAALGRKLRIVTQATPFLAEPLRLDRLVAALLADKRDELSDNVEVEAVAGAGLWDVDADRALIRTALNELLDNALAATGSRGRIVIETENQRLDRDFVASRPALTQGDYVHLAIRDEGTGMTAEQSERAFVPFCGGQVASGPQAAEAHLGLGLSIALGAVSQSGGHLEIESQPDRGTALHLYLPRAKLGGAAARKARPARPQRDADAPQPQPADAAGQTEDDEGMIR